MKKIQTENQNRDSYQTGSTKPPKSYQGIIAVLLILVIFLGGIVSALSMLNVRLFKMLENRENGTQNSLLRFSRVADGAAEAAAEGLALPELGLTGQEITELCRSYYGWPEGLYISNVSPSSPAAKADLRQGDILVALDGIPVASENALAAAVSEKAAGEKLLVTVFRKGSSITVPLTVGE